jgi:hypothetical protein
MPVTGAFIFAYVNNVSFGLFVEHNFMEFSATYYIFTAAQLLLGGSESILHHLP